MRRSVHLWLTGLVGLAGLMAGCSLNPQPEPPMASAGTTPGSAGTTGMGGESRGSGGSAAAAGGTGEYSGAGGGGPTDGAVLPLSADASADASSGDAGEPDAAVPDAGPAGDAAADR